MIEKNKINLNDSVLSSPFVTKKKLRTNIGTISDINNSN